MIVYLSSNGTVKCNTNYWEAISINSSSVLDSNSICQDMHLIPTQQLEHYQAFKQAIFYYDF